MNELLFYLVILLSNIIQGITGFAGTILAMPFSLKLVGMEVAVPVLNLLGLLSGVYVFAGNRSHVDKKVLKHVVVVMGCAVLLGLFIRQLLSASPRLLYITLGVIVVLIALHGLYTRLLKKNSTPREAVTKDTPFMTLLLLTAGVVHGMFVCGGPLLIGYMTRKLPEKSAFRATISTIWIFLNGIILITQIISGAWSLSLVKTSCISLPFLFGGMFIGGKLYSKMSQDFFILLTYILLLIAGASLFFK